MKNHTTSESQHASMQGDTAPFDLLTRRKAAIALVGGLAVLTTGISLGSATPPQPETVRLGGVVRDMISAHSDFGVAGESGHTAALVSQNLGDSMVPVFTGVGLEVWQEWYDLDGHPIAPYGDAGFIGGHFDVDVYDAETDKEEYHKHQYDDAYDVTYIDLVNDARLLLGDIVGSGYANPLRLEFVNAHNGGGGVFDFEAGGTTIHGQTSLGFETTFNPAELVALRVQFYSLGDLRGTSPGTSQSDVSERDGAFSIRMWDTVSNELVYELATYHHVKNGVAIEENFTVDGMVGEDSCGDPIADVGGAFGGASTGDITDSSSFGQWFRDVPGVNIAQRQDVTLTLNADGDYEYTNNAFFPIDGEQYGNEGEAHNQNFTYSVQADFQYHSCDDQFFEFEGSDDAWVFIDDQLVIDLGGTGSGTRQFIALDRLNLADGETHTLRLFYAKRRPTDESIFNIRTNLEFVNRQISLPGGALHD